MVASELDESYLPVPEVREVLFPEALKVVDEIDEMAKDEGVERTLLVNCMIVNAPILKAQVERLRNWDGELRELPEIDELIMSIDMTVNHYKVAINRVYAQ